jgi:hypothetical protein
VCKYAIVVHVRSRGYIVADGVLSGNQKARASSVYRGCWFQRWCCRFHAVDSSLSFQSLEVLQYAFQVQSESFPSFLRLM